MVGHCEASTISELRKQLNDIAFNTPDKLLELLKIQTYSQGGAELN